MELTLNDQLIYCEGLIKYLDILIEKKGNHQIILTKKKFDHYKELILNELNTFKS